MNSAAAAAFSLLSKRLNRLNRIRTPCAFARIFLIFSAEIQLNRKVRTSIINRFACREHTTRPRHAYARIGKTNNRLVDEPSFNFAQDKPLIMEAERINQIQNSIDDLRRRLIELRGYL